METILKSKLKNLNIKIKIDIILVIIFSIIAFGIAAYFDLFELFLENHEKFEVFELDEIFVSAVVIMIAFAFFSFRRWKELVHINEELQNLAFFDELTALMNRRGFYVAVERELRLAEKFNQKATIMFINIDRFKKVNEMLGHYTGDELIRKVGARIVSCTGEADIVARLGGDEFIIFFPNIGDDEKAGIFAQKILNAISRDMEFENHNISVTASIGISMYPEDSNNIENLVQNADLAMSEAKKRNGNQYYIYAEDEGGKFRYRALLEEELYDALVRQEFELHYQPIYKLGNNNLVAVEALLRWRHPVLGIIPPHDFIPLVEKNGLMIPIGEWVLHNACRQLKIWHESGLKSLKVSVNISVLQLRDKEFPDRVSRAFLATGIEPQALVFEILENQNITEPEIIDMLIRLRKIGINWALDDFGTGYSTFAYLKTLPITSIKVDKSLIKNIAVNSKDALVLNSIISMAHILEFEVIAEGIETQEQLECIEKLLCDKVQGYYLSKPLPLEQIEEKLKQELL